MSEEKQDFPTAIPAPDTDVTPLTLTMLGELLTQSKLSPRKRLIQRVHKSHGEPVHRMFNALQPGTYITPHRHMHPPKCETVLVMSGSLLYVEFTDEGELFRHVLVQPGTEIFGIDVAPHVYHTFIALKADTIMFEVKDGPYVAASDKDIPDWAPKEGTEEANAFLLDLIKELAVRTSAEAEEMKKAEENAEAEDPAQ